MAIATRRFYAIASNSTTECTPRCSTTSGPAHLRAGSSASKAAAPNINAIRITSRTAGRSTVACGRFERCHTRNVVENRPYRARSWHGFYLAVLFDSRFLQDSPSTSLPEIRQSGSHGRRAARQEAHQLCRFDDTAGLTRPSFLARRAGAVGGGHEDFAGTGVVSIVSIWT